jgi:hypothetical protein
MEFKMRKYNPLIITLLLLVANYPAYAHRTSPTCKKAIVLSEAKTDLTVQQIEHAKKTSHAEAAPEFTVFNMRGGVLLINYLNGYCSIDDLIKGEKLIDDDSAFSTMAEIAMAIAELKKQNKYGEREHHKVQALEKAIEENFAGSELASMLKDVPDLEKF